MQGSPFVTENALLGTQPDDVGQTWRRLRSIRWSSFGSIRKHVARTGLTMSRIFLTEGGPRFQGTGSSHRFSALMARLA